jgi:hypothetical protein
MFSDQAADKLAEALGADADGFFPCPLPGHGGRARLHYESGEYWLGCCQGPKRSLGEVRGARAYGADRRLSNKEIAVWWRRLAYDHGQLEPVPVDVPEVDEGAPDEVRTARDGFALLLGLRRSDYEPEPVPFSVNFVAAWCRISRNKAARALTELRDRDVIRVVEHHRSMPLYEPGSGSTLSTAVDRRPSVRGADDQ